jgi:TPR repeat protein
MGCDKDEHMAHHYALISAEKVRLHISVRLQLLRNLLQGCALGLNNLGHCLENGIGCSKDISQAVQMYNVFLSLSFNIAA